MNAILTPQAKSFLSVSVREILAQYNVSDSVANKLATEIVERFDNKILLHLQEMNKLHEAAVIQEALKQCQKN